jgi:hypothetical protein
MSFGDAPEDGAEVGDAVDYTLTKGWQWVVEDAGVAAMLERERNKREGRHAAARLWAAIVRELQKVPIKWG